jgi:solute carrier family 35 protein F1/2
LCAVVDIHATILIVYAYQFTTITSVMLLEDFTIPSAFLMSMFFLKVKYQWTHVVALVFCIGGMAVNLTNDIFIKPKDDDGSSGVPLSKHIIGDCMALGGAFLYALSNIL